MTVPPAVTSFVAGQPVAARSSATYQAQIVDQNGAGIPAASLTTLVLTLLDTASDSVINGVNDVNILNAGRGTVDALGNLVITLLPGDTGIFGNVLPGRSQYRSMVIDWTYNSGDSTGRHQVDFAIIALAET